MANQPPPVGKVAVAEVKRQDTPSARAARLNNQPAAQAERNVTVHYDVAAIVRSALIELATVVFASAFFVVAWRGGTNYPTTPAVVAATKFAAGESATSTKP